MLGERGEYELLDRLSTGGMAEVFRARRRDAPMVAPRFAVKRMLPALANQRHFVDMFIDEACIGARLTHPNIVRTVDFGRADGEYFIVFDLVHGVDLLDVLARCSARNVVTPPHHACRIVADVCAALAYAHNVRDETGRALKVVHRDVSPANILVSRGGIVKLIDFGVATATERSVCPTDTGIVKGKVQYLPPERVIGRPADHRGDIFAAGAVLWELLTGEPLFNGKSDADIFAQIRYCAAPPPSAFAEGIPVELDHIVGRALARDVEERYQDAAELRHHLRRYLRSTAANTDPLELARWIATVVPEAPTAPIERIHLAAPTQPLLTTVDVHFESVPSGATVLKLCDGGARKLGTTPVTVRLDRAVPHRIAMRRHGYARAQRTLELGRESEVTVSCALAPRAAAPARVRTP